jgi:hypothetical protein
MVDVFSNARPLLARLRRSVIDLQYLLPTPLLLDVMISLWRLDNDLEP